jgi:hypothetical protein
MSGLMLVLLGAWGGLAPLIGPYLKFGFQPDQAWHYSMDRLFLSLLPGGIVLLAGLIVLVTRSRWLGGVCAVIAALGGAWFIAGQAALFILTGSTYSDGAPVATSPKLILLTSIACFAGTGALIIFFAALALGRQSIAAHKDHLKFGEPVPAAPAGGLATVGLAQNTPPYNQYQAVTSQPAGYQPAEYQPTEYQPVVPDYPADQYQATQTQYQPVEYQATPQQVVGGQSEFPSQYPDSFDQYNTAGPITYSGGQTQYPGATEQTNPLIRPTTPTTPEQ